MPDLDVPVLVVAAGVAYALAARRARSDGEGPADCDRAPERRQAIAFGAGLVALVVALGPPLEGWATTSLTAHMVSHVVLLVVAAPLLAMGRPVATMQVLLPPRLRRSRVWGWTGGTAVSLALAWIACGVVVQTVAMWVWHSPPFFDAAAGSEPLHALEHACLLGGAMVFWWSVLRGTRGSLGIGVLAMFGAALTGTALGALMTLATTPWYRPYVGVSRAASLSDQQVAGVVMWAFAGLGYVVAAAAIFFAWLSQGEPEPSADTPVPPRRRAVGSPA